MTIVAFFEEPTGQGWVQMVELAVAFGLSALIGLERELRHKSAGIRTYTVIGLGSALFMLVSKYGFTNVLSDGRVVLDPSRMAAQIVSGLGFIGAGIIFVRKDSVRGLTTAASVWFTAAVGAAAAGGLVELAVASTAAYFLAILALPLLAGAIGRFMPPSQRVITVRYLDGKGLLRAILAAITSSGMSVRDMETVALPKGAASARSPFEPPLVEVMLNLSGSGDVGEIVARLHEITGVIGVHVGATDEE